MLDELAAATPLVQQRLPERYRAATGRGEAASVFFVDVTDTWFEGRGCELARRHRTKDGQRNRWSIGIVLVADAKGFPLVWQVVSSKTKDHQAMSRVIEEVRHEPWAAGVPFVFDRAMGREGSLRELMQSGLRFVTAVAVNSIESYTTALPHRLLCAVELEGTEEGRERDCELMAQAARETELQEVEQDLFVLDLGHRELAGLTDKGVIKWPPRRRGLHTSLVARLRLARQLQGMLDAGQYPTKIALARDLGLTRARLMHLLSLLRLAPEIQDHLLVHPEAREVTEYRLRNVLKEPDHDKQREMVRTIVRSWGQPADDPRGAAGEEQAGETEAAGGEARPGRVRLVAYFNPQMYVDQYRRAQEHLAEIHGFVAELNEELSRARQSRKEQSTRRKVVRKLERYDYSDLFDLRLVPITVRTRSDNEVRSFRCELSLKQKQWERRQRYNGFVLLVARADVEGEAEQLVRLYRAKDTVEKDFQTIKSVVKLRPIFHHTDPKVVAHVTLCMLALALERALEARLHRGQVKLTAPACLEILRTCHLNEMHERAGGRGIYSVTRPTTAQREVLDALGMAHLVEDAAVSRALIPRFVPTP